MRTGGHDDANSRFFAILQMRLTRQTIPLLVPLRATIENYLI